MPQPPAPSRNAKPKNPSPVRASASKVKKFLDRVGSLAGLLLLSPLLLLLCLAIRLKLGRPVFFRQRRPGFQGKPFEFIKFRTMLDLNGPDGQPLSDEARLTPFGEWLRRTSLDELPQLINVLKGELSFVGPRPLLMEYLSRYSPEQARRHAVLPGITGWAQVNGRNSISWEEKFRLDLWYVDHWSLLFDMQILFLTVKKVLFPEGIKHAGSATMPKFMGSSSERP